MHLRTLIISVCLYATSLPGYTADSGDTEALYQQHCTSCHGSDVYTRGDRKVASLDGLHSQVQRCELALGLRWFDEEIADMTDYLNRRYYHFEP